MHMADALISPAVGGTMWIATAGVAAYSIKKIQGDMDDKKIPLMGVMAAFVFAAQMINFTIPGTGSSGHIGGGLLLAILLGPYAGFLAMASILSIQALFFADGGLLALGCNIFNLGFFTCFIAYPLIYKPLIAKGYTSRRIFGASMIAAVIGLQLGSFGVVLETLISGKTELPFSTFVLMMQPIHLAIGIVEGVIIAAVVSFIWKERPEILEKAALGEALGSFSIKKVLTVLALLAVFTGGVLSWFASDNPDGLEWSMLKTAGVEELEAPNGIHQTFSQIQSRFAFLPDYSFKISKVETSAGTEESEGGAGQPAVSGGTSIAGIVGGGLTLAFVVFIGFVINLIKKRKQALTN
ncbi:energy-coupling factor ABC transporter permease [Dehalobacterium formicoaceticum]|uniref:Energy-coupling factor ABC transporter permease n=1 Tax=Dehalobacterium formicoaceticum TaxID=51515 RepID=A0ABT1XZL3_9FIRM|nr:energy-coupling factor ABC transporter permease [Dehalobacterium formicoaceticum]MCR6544053.1 energy-coupling factor ABC transporter permease [Dehalobacterium formicoaceticum]